MVAGARIAPLPAEGARALDADGYLIFRAAIPTEWLEPLRERFEAAVLPSERWPVPRGVGWRHALLDADPLVRRVCRLPAQLSAAHHILKSPFFLAQAEGRGPEKDGGHQALHRDGMAEAPGRNVSALAFLDAFGAENGATRLIPGSHRSEASGPEIGIAGEAGDVVLFNADLLHAGSRNVSGAPRRSLLIGYAGQELLAAFERTNAMRGLSDAPREMFGLEPMGRACMMYRPRPFIVDDLAVLHGVIRARAFATLAMAHGDRAHLAYAPAILDAAEGLGALRFHLAKANPLAGFADGARLTVSFVGPDAYVSPDWYASDATVPTWNYVAVEGEGIATRLDHAGLVAVLEDLSAQEEEKLRPKRPWTLDKLPRLKQDTLLNAIAGFSLRLDRLEGKFKLSQDKTAADIAGALAGLEARGDAASLAIAAAMRASAKPIAP